MSDASMQDRTEAPTQKRLQDARRKGQIPRSQDLGAAVLLLGGALVLKLAGAGAARGTAELFVRSMDAVAHPPASLDASALWIRSVTGRAALLFGPILIGLAVTALAIGGAQGRGVLTMEPLRPTLSRISPMQGIGRLLGPGALVELAKALLKLACIALALRWALAGAWTELATLPQRDAAALLAVCTRYGTRTLAFAGGALLALAGLDYGYQVWKHLKQMRMTKEEVKQEQKESEGDAMVRARRRSMGRSLARRRMFRDVPTADVVVTNPTHIAVALRYDPAVAAAPVVVAMGERKVAQRIKAVALEAGVPVVENKPLARALLATARIGLPIPAELYVAVAEVLAFVLRRRAQRLEVEA